jgi:hypothetical protein
MKFSGPRFVNINTNIKNKILFKEKKKERQEVSLPS